jgi:gliding motility associated protien GldN
MKTMKFFSCLVAALAFFASATTVQAQNPLLASNNTQPPARDSIYNSEVNRRLPLTYPKIHERDVMWEKRIWQEIDVREKRNQHFAATERPLATILMEAAESGKVRAFGTMDDQFKSIMTQQEIQSMLYTIDTSMIYNFETEQYEPVVTRAEFNPEDVQRYRIKEVWYFDSRRGRMDKRILGIAPIINRFDEDGNFIASMPMCWFYFDDLRKILASEKAPSNYNDVAYQSWDDVFLARNFGSYITKESNMMDRRIQDYASGANTLYEAEKIKEKIRNFEHDQYSY